MRVRGEVGPAGVAASFAARGLHTVLLPWLLLGAASASPFSIGVVQGSALGAQALVLAALGGVGDRWGTRAVAVAGQLAASVPAFALAAAGPTAPLAALAVYALASGALWGLVSPARDALVATGRGGDLLHPTAGLLIAQFVGLLAGIALASRAGGADAGALLLFQGVLHLAAAASFACSRAPRRREEPGRAAFALPRDRNAAREMILLSALFGLTSAGPFAVWAPLFAAEAGGRAADALALLLALFPAGTIAASLALRRVARPFDKRHGMLAAHVAASLALAGAAQGHSLAAVAAGVALWGFCGGAFVTCGRARLLESRPVHEHARLLAALQLALLAASTAGAALAGVAAAHFAVRPSMALFAVGSLAAVAAFAASVDSRPRRRRRPLIY
jgi:hypothetical protein